MKKLLAVLFVAAAFVFGAFAEDPTFPSGSWVDELYNGEWVIGADSSVKLLDSKTGDLIFNFTEDKITNKQFSVDQEGVSISFECAATHRKYKFTKEFNTLADIKIVVDPDWDTEVYGQLLKFKSIN